MTMTASDARIALETVVKPLRALLDVQQILDTAVALEGEARDNAAEIAKRRDAILTLEGELCAARARVQEEQAEAHRTVAKAAEKAAGVEAAAQQAALGIIEKARIDSEVVAKNIDKALAEATAKVSECEAAAVKALTAKHNAEIALADLTKAVTDEQAKLAAIRAAIAKATAPFEV